MADLNLSLGSGSVTHVLKEVIVKYGRPECLCYGAGVLLATHSGLRRGAKDRTRWPVAVNSLLQIRLVVSEYFHRMGRAFAE